MIEDLPCALVGIKGKGVFFMVCFFKLWSTVWIFAFLFPHSTYNNNNNNELYPQCSACPTLCDCMDCSPPGSSVCGILQARILEWVVISSSRESSQSPGIESVPPALTGATGNPLVSRITVGRPELWSKTKPRQPRTSPQNFCICSNTQNNYL